MIVDYKFIRLSAIEAKRHMTRHRAEAKERGSVESGVVSLRVHGSPPTCLSSTHDRSALQNGA